MNTREFRQTGSDKLQVSRLDMLRYGVSLATVTALGGSNALARVAEPAALSPQRASKPNILFMLVDNLGYGELGCYVRARDCGSPT